jgi:hypothetical protein
MRSTRVDLGVHAHGQVQFERRAGLVGDAADRLDGSHHDPVHVDALGPQLGDARVEPADLEQVGEQRFEPVQLRDEQFRAAP